MNFFFEKENLQQRLLIYELTINLIFKLLLNFIFFCYNIHYVHDVHTIAKDRVVIVSLFDIQKILINNYIYIFFITVN